MHTSARVFLHIVHFVWVCFCKTGATIMALVRSAPVQGAVSRTGPREPPTRHISGLGALWTPPLDIPDQIRQSINRYHEATAEFTKMLISIPALPADANETERRSHDAFKLALLSPRSTLYHVDKDTHISTLLRSKAHYLEAADIRAQYATNFPVHANLRTTIREAIDARVRATQFYNNQRGGGNARSEKHRELNRVFLQVATKLRPPNRAPVPVGLSNEAITTSVPNPTTHQPEVNHNAEMVIASPLAAAQSAPPGFRPHQIETQTAPNLNTPATAAARPSVSSSIPAPVVAIAAARPSVSSSIPAPVVATATLPVTATPTPADPLRSPRAFLKKCLPQFLINQLNARPELKGHLEGLNAILEQALASLARSKFGNTCDVSECLKEVPALLSALCEPSVASAPSLERADIVAHPGTSSEVPTSTSCDSNSTQVESLSTEEEPGSDAGGPKVLTSDSGSGEDRHDDGTAGDSPELGQPYVLPVPDPPLTISTNWRSLNKEQTTMAYKICTAEVEKQLLEYGDPSFELIVKGNIKSHEYEMLARNVRLFYGTAVRTDPMFQTLREELADAIKGREWGAWHFEVEDEELRHYPHYFDEVYGCISDRQVMRQDGHAQFLDKLRNVRKILMS
jgi:hypothetical protein